MAPKSKTLLSDAYVRLMESPYPDDPHGRTWREMIHDKLAEMAAAGKKSAIRELRRWDALFGPRPKSTV